MLDANLRARSTPSAPRHGHDEAPGGRIINIASVVGLSGNKGQANYAASKAGLIGLTKSVAKEYAAATSWPTASRPGYIETDMTARLPEAAKAALLQGRSPLGRLGRPEDIAGRCCSSPPISRRYITGQVLVVDGGMVI